MTITLDHDRGTQEKKRGAHTLLVDSMGIAWSGGQTRTFKRGSLDVTGGESCTH